MAVVGLVLPQANRPGGISEHAVLPHLGKAKHNCHSGCCCPGQLACSSSTLKHAEAVTLHYSGGCSILVLVNDGTMNGKNKINQCMML